MRWIGRGAWTLAVLAASLAWPVTASADSKETAAAAQTFYGPLRARDLSPFGFLRLDMRPTFAGSLGPGKWAVETELAYQNTWALSDGVQQYLQSREGRRDLTAADVAAIAALPGENYLVDMELMEFDVTLHRQLTPAWGAYLILSGVAYGDGVFDGMIEQFHSAFGISNRGRESVTRGQINLLFDLDSVQSASLDAGHHSGLLDPTLGLRYTGIELPAPWSLALEVAAKVPVGGTRDWLSTGRTDVGAQASLMRRGTRHAFFSSLSLVDYAGSDQELHPDAEVVPTLVVGVDSHLTGRTHSIVQFYASPSVFGAAQTRLEELTADKYLVSLGLRYHYGAHLVSFAVTENLANYDNTPDLALQLGYAYRPQ
ncbi:MAG TPA: DUF3187 family protein [Steroidobacteraceae bacterium]